MRSMVKKSLPHRRGGSRVMVMTVAITLALTLGGPVARAKAPLVDPATIKKGTVENTGSAARTALPIIATLITWLKGDRNGFVEHALSITVSTAIAVGLKESIKSRRPNGKDFKSFPSGHSAQAFASASFLDHRYGWQYGLPAYLAATYVAFSRVNSDEHHIRDVAAGALISWGVSHAFVHHDDRMTVDGAVSPHQAMLRLHINW